LYPEHAAELFSGVPVGTPVRIINQPVSVGDRGDLLYLSVARPVEDYPSQGSLLKQAVDALIRYKNQQNAPKIDWHRVQEVVDARLFMPVAVSIEAPSLDQVIASIKPEKYDFEPYGIEANSGALPELLRQTGAVDQESAVPEGPDNFMNLDYSPAEKPWPID
jgi:L,D-transpeptidase ErfK/SrfK